MKKLLCLTLALCLLMPCTCACAESFLFRNGVTWQSTMAEVWQSETVIDKGYENEYVEYNDMFRTLMFTEALVSQYCPTLTYYFYGEQLAIAEYRFQGVSSTDRDYLMGALADKYGQFTVSDPQLATLLEAADFDNPYTALTKSWTLDDGTYIAAYSAGSHAFRIVYFNTPVVRGGPYEHNITGL